MNRSALNRFIAIAVLLVVTVVAMIVAKPRIGTAKEQAKTQSADTATDPAVVTEHQDETETPDTEETEKTDDEAENDYILKETDAASSEYLDRIVFIGDRTIGNIEYCPIPELPRISQQVWSLDENASVSKAIVADTFLHPVWMENVSFITAIKDIAPPYAILTFGSYSDGEGYTRDSLIKAYSEFIGHLISASPNTQIIIQSILPVGKGCPIVSSEQIAERNEWLKDFCKQNHIYYLDTYSALVNEEGYLRIDFYDPDNIYSGIQNYTMNYAGYSQMIYYVRTHVHPSYVPQTPDTSE